MSETATLGSGAMFDGIAKRYDLLNRIISLGLDQRWRRRTIAAMQLEAGDHVLDLATGTADLAILSARTHEVRVTGVDPSANMLAVGREKVTKKALDERVTLALGDAQELAYDEDTFDACCMAFGIRNVPDRDAALRELRRVVRPGGRIAILELSEPPPGVLGFFARLHVHHVVPWLGGLLSGSKEYRYLQRSIAAFPPPDEFAEQMRGAGLEVVEVAPQTFGACCLYVAEVPS